MEVVRHSSILSCQLVKRPLTAAAGRDVAGTTTTTGREGADEADRMEVDVQGIIIVTTEEIVLPPYPKMLAAAI